MTFKGKTFVLTGGAGGLGRVTAKRLVAEGAQVFLIDIAEDRLNSVAKELNAPEQVGTFVSDLSTPEKCAEALDAVGRPIYGLIHYAGIMRTDVGTPQENREVFDATIASNLTSAFDVANAFEGRHVTNEPARFVLISSMAFRRGAFDRAAYSAAKGGLVGLVRAFARRWGGVVNVNGLAPGIILTDMPKDVIAERGDQLLREIPMKRFGEPEETASVALFLCGPDSTYVTSQIINVDGGAFNT